jgi:hypothetical protein
VNDRDCLPFHLTSWLDGRPEWKSDWTKQHAVSVIHCPFNGAAKQRLIARRPMTDDEFESLLVAAENPRKKVDAPYPSGRKVNLPFRPYPA